MTVGDFPDYDAAPIWQGAPLYYQASGNFPAAGTQLFAGAVTNWQSLQIRGFATQGGVRLAFRWCLDAALTQVVGIDDFDAPLNQGFNGVYEVQAPYVQINVNKVTTSPAGQGTIAIIPSRAPALGFRALTFPQQIALNNLSIPALSSSVQTFKWLQSGLLKMAVSAVTPASACTFTLDFINYDGTVAEEYLDAAVLAAGFAQDFMMPPWPLRLTIANTTAGAATVSALLTGQQQGW